MPRTSPTPRPGPLSMLRPRWPGSSARARPSRPRRQRSWSATTCRRSIPRWAAGPGWRFRPTPRGIPGSPPSSRRRPRPSATGWRRPTRSGPRRRPRTRRPRRATRGMRLGDRGRWRRCARPIEGRRARLNGQEDRDGDHGSTRSAADRRKSWYFHGLWERAIGSEQTTVSLGSGGKSLISPNPVPRRITLTECYRRPWWARGVTRARYPQ